MGQNLSDECKDMTQICKHTWQRLGSGFTGWMTHPTSDFHCYKEPVPHMGYYWLLLTWGILKSKVSRESISPPLPCSFCRTAKESRPFWWGCLESSGQLLPVQSWASPTSTAAASSVLKLCSPTWPQHPLWLAWEAHIFFQKTAFPCTPPSTEGKFTKKESAKKKTGQKITWTKNKNFRKHSDCQKLNN